MPGGRARGLCPPGRGEARVNGEALGPGDAARIHREPLVRIEAPADAEVLLFDLPGSSE
jgi:hypothetical protein